MKIKQDSFIVWFAYLMDRITATERKPFIQPTNTTLCDLLCRCVITPFGLVMFGTIFLIFGALFVVCWPFIWLSDDLPRTKPAKKLAQRWENSVIRNAILDFKNKTCTRVEIEP